MASISGSQKSWLLLGLLSIVSCCCSSLIGMGFGQVSSFIYSILAVDGDQYWLSILLSGLVFFSGLLVALLVNLLARRLMKRSRQ